MDRRTLLGGAGIIGTVGTLGAAGAGLALRNSAEDRGPAARLAQSAGSAQRSVAPKNATLAAGVALGYLPGSAGMFASPTHERLMRDTAVGLSWAAWSPAQAAASAARALHSLFRTSRTVGLSIGALHRPETSSGSLQTLAITAHFAIDDAPWFAEFPAWSYTAAGPTSAERRTQPLTFSSRAPDTVALAIDYALRSESVPSSVQPVGSLYLPIGTSTAALDGLASGLYVVAGPDAGGALPDFAALIFNGDVNRPIASADGRPIAFEYLTIAVRPVAV